MRNLFPKRQTKWANEGLVCNACGKTVLYAFYGQGACGEHKASISQAQSRHTNKRIALSSAWAELSAMKARKAAAKHVVVFRHPL